MPKRPNRDAMNKGNKKRKNKSGAEPQGQRSERVSSEVKQEPNVAGMHFDKLHNQNEEKEENLGNSEEIHSDNWRGKEREFSNFQYKSHPEKSCNYQSRKSEPCERNNKSFENRTDKRWSLNEHDRGSKGHRDISNGRMNFRSARGFNQDAEFNTYQAEFQNHKGEIDYTKVEEVVSDLFEAPEDYSLAHCVAEDMNMGSGIAVPFRQKFKRVDELLNQHQRTGGLAILEEKQRYIYYLVTKKFSSGKPTYGTLFSSLKRLRNHVMENKVKKLAMPRIGCGLDRLEWENVKFMVEFVFREVDVEIVVCNLEPSEESPQQRNRSCKVTNETYPIQDIAEGTVILYFSSEDEFISDEMRKLDEKFHFLTEFRNARKLTGNVIVFTRNQNYLLCGCIIKKRKTDPFDFVNLRKCLSNIQKENKKYEFYYYAFQAFRDEDDPCINQKIINILRNSLRNSEVYVCWPGDLQDEMTPRDRFIEDRESGKFGKWDRRGKNDNNDSYSSLGGDWNNSVSDNSRTDDDHTKESFETSNSEEHNFEANSSWFQNSPDHRYNRTLQNYSFGSSEQTKVLCDYCFENDSEFGCDENLRFKNFEQTEIENNCDIETNENLNSFAMSIRNEDKDGSQKARTSWSQEGQMSQYNFSESVFEDDVKDYSPQTSTSLNQENQPSAWAISQWDDSTADESKITQESKETESQGVNYEYESFLTALKNNTIRTLKENNSIVPKQYSLICFVQEDVNIECEIPQEQNVGPLIGKLLNQNAKKGDLAYVKNGNAFLYCLIVSEVNKPPESEMVFSAIQKLKQHVTRNNVKKLLIPVNQMSGDLNWSEVKCMFQYILGKSQIEMIPTSSLKPIYNIQTLTKTNKIKLSHAKSSIHQMKSSSGIICLTSADGFITDEIRSLDKKFNCCSDFPKNKNKSLGSVIEYTDDENRILFVCIIKRKMEDGINFEELYKCVMTVKRKIQAEKISLVGIQAIKSEDEGSTFKILTIMRYCLRDIEIKICWPKELRNFMPSK